MESILRVRTKDGIIDIPALQGADGLSAYQIWLNAGNTGTEADFLESLKGGSDRTTDYVVIPDVYFEYNDRVAIIRDYDGIILKKQEEDNSEIINKEIVKIEYLDNDDWKDIAYMFQSDLASPSIRTNKYIGYDLDYNCVVIAIITSLSGTPQWWGTPEQIGQLKITYYTD
jgi:hypothetical protein